MRLSFLILFFISTCFAYCQDIIPGAERTELYISKLKNKRIAVTCNHTSVVKNMHLIDFLLKNHIQVVKIFAPEHGFRGQADAGAKINSEIDRETGIVIRSLYGKNLKPKKEDIKGVDIMLFDIQDVGVRFYTYISTLQYVMEACGDAHIPVIVLDRPNPNGHYIDGPVLESKYKSFVGMQPIPIVYGMTIGEYAQMLIGEKWINSLKYPKLEVIPCQNYSHRSRVILNIPPSPNLKSERAIALYPSLCLFEGTNVSVGRGTDRPFEMYGSPYINLTTKGQFKFTPRSMAGATNPPFLGKECVGEYLGIGTYYDAISNEDSATGIRNLKVTKPHGIMQKDVGAGLGLSPSFKNFSLQYLLSAYRNWNGGDSFFLKNLFFDKLAGNATLRWQIINGKSEVAIRASWSEGIEKFKRIRKKYLLYSDFY